MQVASPMMIAKQASVGGVQPYDPLFSNVRLLYNMDDAVGSNTIVDSSLNGYNCSGFVARGVNVVSGGVSGNALASTNLGTNDTATKPDLQFGANQPWCVEYFIKYTNPGNINTRVLNLLPFVVFQVGTTLQVSNGVVHNLTIPAPLNDVWQYFKISCIGTELKLRIDGVLVATDTYEGTASGLQDKIEICRNNSTSSLMMMDCLRITKDDALDFDGIPTTPFPTS